MPESTPAGRSVGQAGTVDAGTRRGLPYPVVAYLVDNLRALWGRAYVRVVGTNRELSWLFFDTVLPVLAVVAYVYIYRSLKAPEVFVGYVILGGAISAYWLHVLWGMGSTFYFDKQSGQLELFFIAPISRMAILGGMAFGGMIQTTVRAAGALILGSLAFGVRYRTDALGLLVVGFLVTLIALYGLGMVFASLFLLHGREAWHLANLLQEPVFLLSGFYFPVKALGFWVAALAGVVPLTLGLDALRQLAFADAGMGLLPAGVEVAINAGLAVLYLAGAALALAHMERVAKREGRLTMRWQ
ncbi:MAG: ABC transporter permease [Bacillota bacterium]|nr:ABC transporter permease [Bacillota bacterium]